MEGEVEGALSLVSEVVWDGNKRWGTLREKRQENNCGNQTWKIKVSFLVLLNRNGMGWALAGQDRTGLMDGADH